MTSTTTLTMQAETAASDIRSGDWDDEGTAAIYLPAETAVKALYKMGFTYTGNLHNRDGMWRSPANMTFWETDDALAHALVALGETLEVQA